MFVLQERQLASAAGWLLSVSKTLCDEDREFTIFLGDYRIVSFFMCSTPRVAKRNAAVSLREGKHIFFSNNKIKLTVPRHDPRWPKVRGRPSSFPSVIFDLVLLIALRGRG